MVTACHERCEYIGRASACAFTTTERALPGIKPTPDALFGHSKFNALTCCVLCFAEPAAGDLAAPMWNLFSALCPCHNIESTFVGAGKESNLSSVGITHASTNAPPTPQKCSHRCILVSSEVSHRTARMVSRCRACRAWLAHSGYPLGHVPRSPRTAIDACAIRRMLSHLEAHSAI